MKFIHSYIRESSTVNVCKLKTSSPNDGTQPYMMKLLILTNRDLSSKVKRVNAKYSRSDSDTPFAPNSSAGNCIDLIGKSIGNSTTRTFRFAVVLESTGRYILAKTKRCGKAESKYCFHTLNLRAVWSRLDILTGYDLFKHWNSRLGNLQN